MTPWEVAAAVLVAWALVATSLAREYSREALWWKGEAEALQAELNELEGPH